MNKLIIFSCLFFFYVTASAQLTIEACYSKAQANYPLIKQSDLIENSKDYNLSNAGKGYLPQVSFSAKATVQSDVTQLPFDFSQLGIQGVKTPSMSKDHYGATVDVNQVVWDGGVIKSKREGIRTSSEIEMKNLEVDLYAINDRVNQVFFGILLFDARIEQNRIYQEDLRQNSDKIRSWVANGVANQADLDAVKVEQLKALQAESQLLHTRDAYLSILSALVGEALDTAVVLVKPKVTTRMNTAIRRPELELFDAQIRNLESQHKEINAGLMPRLGVFVTGGYGRPALNMLDNDFSAYYIAGVNLSWNFSNLYSNKNNKRKIRNNIASVQTRQETFLFNTGLDVTRKQSEINNYRDQLKYDDDIISLRSSIRQSSEAKMSDGTISGVDLMRDVHAEELAKQDKILHEIEMLQAIYNLRYVTNN